MPCFRRCGTGVSSRAGGPNADQVPDPHAPLASARVPARGRAGWMGAPRVPACYAVAGSTWSPILSVLRHSEQTTASWVAHAVTSGRS